VELDIFSDEDRCNPPPAVIVDATTLLEGDELLAVQVGLLAQINL